MPRSYRKYLIVLSIAFGITMGSICALNVIVAPFDPFPSAPWARYRDGLQTRNAKGEALSRGTWDVILTGNSRIEVGLDPQHPAWGNAKVYNAGLSNTTFEQLDLAIRMALREPSVKWMIIGVDLSDFDPSRMAGGGDYLKSLLNPDLSPTEYFLTNLLSISATQSSMASLLNAHNKTDGLDWPLGRYEVRWPSNLWALWDIHRYTQYVEESGPGARPEISWRHMKLLADRLDDASRRGVRVTLVHLPFHAVHFEQWSVTPEWELTEPWIRGVVEIVRQHNLRFPNNKIDLWDFTEYGTFTTEELPPKGGKFYMRWFWDTSHYKKELGDLIIDRITGFPPPAGFRLDDFGLRLTPDNLAAHLERMRKVARLT